MESVKAFNAELSSLYEFKPPISKAKMTALTRGAIKAIKFYKHVVQSVEKFILKCKPEYKIPGLYVIDSIVRQSRHQFGTEKDVFAPRFAKNIQQTFINLYQCPPEDKSKIIRVLNLWQKNQVFPPDVVQPLFDLADPNNPIYKEMGTPAQANGHNANALPKGSPALQKTPTKTSQSNESQQGGVNLNLTDPSVLLQLQQLQRLITRSGESKNDSQVHFDKKLLDFDYGDEEEEINPSPKPVQNETSVASLLTNPEVLRQLQTLQQTMANAQQEADADKMRKLQEMKQQEEEFDKHLAQTVPNLPFASQCEFKPGDATLGQGFFVPPPNDLTQTQPTYKNPYEIIQPPPEQNNYENVNNENDNDVEVITLDHADSSRSPSQDRRRRRSRSRSRDNRRDRDRRSRRSRSRSRSKRHRSRSRDRDRDRGNDRKEKEKETERDKERKKRGLPTIKKDNLSVCSTTLWVGHLSKLVHQDDLSNTFGEFGDIVSIDLIPPRGCAFIVMHRRQDAARCLAKLKNHVIHSKAITLAWAPGKGVKGKDLKDYWEGDLGVSYIPWTKLKPDIDLDLLEDGGMIDEETMPDWMRAKIEGSAKHQASMVQIADNIPAGVDTSQPPPMPGAGLLQPPLSLPMVPPFQFNNRLLAPPNMLNLPPSMMPNVPLGVPPPNLQNQLMSNPLLGIGSPFQGGLIPPPPISITGDNSAGATETNMKNLTDSLMSLSQSFGMMSGPLPTPIGGGASSIQDDNMDVEMEDAGRPNQESQMPQRGSFEKDRNRDDRDRGMDRRDRDRDRDRDKNERNRDRDRRRSRSRDRERERDRNRDRDRRGSSRERDRNRDGGRGRDRRGDRGRPNRWGDRDNNKDDDQSADMRKDKERSLNERLQEMAGGGAPRPNNRDNKENHQQQLQFQPPPNIIPPLLSFPNGPPTIENTNAPIVINDDDIERDEPEPEKLLDFHGPPPEMMPPPPLDGFAIRGGPMIDEFGPNTDEYMGGFRPPPPMMDDFGPPPPMMDDFGQPPPMMDDFGPPPPMMDDFGPPPPMMDDFGPLPPPHDDFPPGGGDFPRHGDRFGRRGGRRGDFRGPRGPPQDFFDDYGPPPQPRDEFMPPPIDDFGQDGGGDFGPRDRFEPRGGGRMRRDFPRMRGGPPRGFPRGGPRGRHAGPWNDRNFSPRFDGPPEFFRGGGRPPRDMYDDGPPPPRRWGGRFDDERRPPPHFNDGDDIDDFPPPDGHRPGGGPNRRSRWGGGNQQNNHKEGEQDQQQNNRDGEQENDAKHEEVTAVDVVEQNVTENKERGVTPVRDEIAEAQQKGEESTADIAPAE